MRYFLFILTVILFHACSTVNENYSINSPSNEIAKQHFNSPDSAIFYAESSLKEYSDNHNAYFSHFLIADAYNTKRNYQLSVKHYFKALELIPEGSYYDQARSRLYWCLGRIFKIHNNYDLAETFYNNALQYVVDEDKPGLLYNIGNNYKAMEQLEKASKIFFEALALAKDEEQLTRQAKIYNKLGFILVETGLYAEAREEYFFEIINQTSVPKYEKYAGKAWHNIAHSYMMEEDYEKAVENLNKALEIKTGTEKFISYKDLGTCLHHLGKYEEAAIAYSNAKDLFDHVDKDNHTLDLYKLMHRNYHALNDDINRTAYIEKYESELEAFANTSRELLFMAQAANIALVYKQEQETHQLNDIIENQNIVLLGVGIGLLIILYLLFRSIIRFVRVRNRMIRSLKQNE